MTNILKERLDKGPVICAEGFLFEIERRVGRDIVRENRRVDG